MIKLRSLILFISVAVFVSLFANKVEAIEYGYTSREAITDSCYRHITYVYDQNGSVITATRLQVIIYNDTTNTIVHDSGVLQNVAQYTVPCLDKSILNVSVRSIASKSGYGGEVESWAPWSSNSNNTVNGMRVNSSFITRLYLTPTKTMSYITPANNEYITTKTITRKFYAKPRSGGDLDHIWDDGVYDWNWNHVVPMQQLGSESNPLNLTPDSTGTVSLPVVTIPNPLDGSYAWWALYLDQDPPIITSVWENRISRYWAGETGLSYFNLATDLTASTPAIGGTLISGSNVTFSSTISNNAAEIISRPSTARFRLDLNNDGTWDTTFSYLSINQLNPRISQNINSSNWIAVTGTHRVESCADYDNMRTDIDRTNNCRTTVFTVRPIATPLPSPTPTLVPAPVQTPACSPNCTVKEIGTVGSIFATFLSEPSVYLNAINKWVRITIMGPGTVANTSVIVKERINSTYFSITTPSYIDSTNNTFKITKLSGGSEVDMTPTICANVSCVTSVTSTAFDATITNVGATDTYYVYFQVNPIQAGVGIAIDNVASTIEYVAYGPANPARIVNIAPGRTSVDQKSYFQFVKGDVFSRSNDASNAIVSQLPAGFVDSSNQSIAITSGGTNWGNGQLNIANRQITQYPSFMSKINYDSLYEKYKKEITQAPIQVGALSSMPSSGFFIDNNVGSDYKLVIGSSWKDRTITGEKLIIFVPGDLQINNSFSITPDGMSLVMFIVKGNIGIDPSLTKIEGIYLADGKIDTSCNTSFSSGQCAPNIL